MSYNDTGINEIKARALCDIDFLLMDISPLTTLHREVDLDEEDDTKTFSGNTEINMRLDSVQEIIDNTTRNEHLFKLYPLLGPSFLKARVAFALGHHAAYYLENTQMGEQLFFECLYILDMCNSEVKGLTPIISGNLFSQSMI